jgi:acetyl esterase/lipase
MADDPGAGAKGVVRLPARDIPLPAGVSDAAREALVLAQARPAPSGYPPLEDKAAWRAVVAAADANRMAMYGDIERHLQADAVEHPLGGVPAWHATPRGEGLADPRQVLLDIHGGALIFFGGSDAVRLNAKFMARRTGRAAYSVDYRMPPDHPYPAALDDVVAAYRALLEIRRPEEIVVSGISAGGNLAAALLLRSRDEGLPMPAGVILLTPEVDLTESGDTFQTLMGLDILPLLIEVNRLYADGCDLAHPYLSPLFGDVSAFPPAFLQTGTRDLFLSNTVRLHRRLRAAGRRAELHVWEGMTHGGFGGLTPEDLEVNAEMRAFIASL